MQKFVAILMAPVIETPIESEIITAKNVHEAEEQVEEIRHNMQDWIMLPLNKCDNLINNLEESVSKIKKARKIGG